MKAIGYGDPLPITDASSLLDIDIPRPEASGHDLLVKVHAIAVNPIDCKVRKRMAPEGQYRVLGWDAVGEVVSVGEKASKFSVGDRVYYAGDLNRQGSNAEYQLVDERIVGSKPESLSNAEAAALPLTSITGWELLFEHLAIPEKESPSGAASSNVLLIVGAAGGVGSVLIQLAKILTGTTVIGTASRESSQEWIKQLGVDYVIDHTQPLQPQIEALDLQVTHIASLTHTGSYFDQYIELLQPFGKIAMIDEVDSLDAMKLKPKSLSLHIEFMFARSMFTAADMDEQGKLLDKISDLIDAGKIKTTVGKNLGAINAENLKLAHQELESGKSIGKIVLEGF